MDPRDVDPTTPSLTFPGLRRNEEKRYGEYRTKRLVLHYYDVMTDRPEAPKSVNADVEALVNLRAGSRTGE